MMNRERDFVMDEKKNNRDKWLHVRLTEAEYRQLRRAFAGTTERKLSAYARKMLLGKPMIAGVRNLTAEGLMPEFAKLLKDLNGIANNYNQAVHKLHTLQRYGQFHSWLASYEMDRRRLLKDVESMKEFIHKSAAVWLQS